MAVWQMTHLFALNVVLALHMMSARVLFQPHGLELNAICQFAMDLPQMIQQMFVPEKVHASLLMSACVLQLGQVLIANIQFATENLQMTLQTFVPEEVLALLQTNVLAMHQALGPELNVSCQFAME